MQQMGVFQAQVFRSHGQNLTDKLERNLQFVQNDAFPPVSKLKENVLGHNFNLECNL
jgi:hypothetical protein